MTIEGPIARRYTKKPYGVEAVQLTRTNAYFVANWCGGSVVRMVNPNDASDVYIGIDMMTYSGRMRIQVSDYVTKDVRGQIGKISELEFESDYQREGARENLAFMENQWHLDTIK